MRSLEKSNQHFQKANNKLPLGVSSNFRYWGDDKTIYVKRGKGARLWRSRSAGSISTRVKGALLWRRIVPSLSRCLLQADMCSQVGVGGGRTGGGRYWCVMV